MYAVFTKGLFLDLASVSQPTLNLLSEASVKSRQVSKCKHRLQLAEMEGGLEGRERTHGCLPITPLERQGAHRSKPSSHSTADGEVGSGILTAITTGGGSQLLSRTVFFSGTNAPVHLDSLTLSGTFCTQNTLLDFHCLQENVFLTKKKKKKKVVILRDHKNGGQFAHKQTEKGQGSWTKQN